MRPLARAARYAGPIYATAIVVSCVLVVALAVAADPR